MSTVTDAAKQAIAGLRAAVGAGGALALIMGVMILVWPGITAGALTTIIAIYAVLAGIAYAIGGVVSSRTSGWSKVGHIVLGVIFVIAGIVAFVNIAAATIGLAVFSAVMVGMLWLFEGVVSLSTVGFSSSKVWTVIYAVLSIIAGVVLLFSPLFGAVVLWWLIGIMLVVLGVINIVRAVIIGRR